MRLASIITALSFSLLGVVALAQSGEANKDYMAAMAKMNKKMEAVTDTDAGISFAKKMIAHHEGAIEMSDIAQRHVKDAELLAMIKKMEPEQQKDIKELKAWLGKHDKR